MATRLQPLFTPLRLNGKTLANRFVVAPMTRTSATERGVPTSEMIEYYQSFAKGGFGMIITEGTYTDDLFSQTNFYQPGMVNTEQQNGWKTLVQEVKKFDTLFICQLMHAGALSQYHQRTLAPSAIQPIGQKMPEAGGGEGPFPNPTQMTLADMVTIREGFVRGALLAKSAGFDGIELHAANGYLFDQFITEYTNHRTDAYGVSLENRLRLLSEVYGAIKEAVGPDFITGIRFSEGKVNDLSYRWPGGSATARQFYQEVAHIKPDYIHIAAEGGQWERECLYPDGTSSNAIAREITGAPVIANGGLHNLDKALSLLEAGHTDLISLGRAAIANPDFPNLASTGQQPRHFSSRMIKPYATLNNTKAFLDSMAQHPA